MGNPSRKLPFYPLLFSLFPALGLFGTNLNQLTLSDLVRSGVLTLLFLSLVGSLCVWALTFLFCRDLRKSALITVIGQSLFFAFGHARGYLESLFVHLQRDLNPNHFVAPAYLMVFVAGAWWTAKRKTPQKIHEYLNVFSVSLLAISVFTIVKNLPARSSLDKPHVTANGAVAPAGHRHNVYYIILDAYGRQDILKKVYSHDNSEFIEGLKKLGFYVASESNSNYPLTVLSIGSSLNFDYLSPQRELSSTSNDQKPFQQLIYDNQVFNRFKEEGYQTIAFWTGFSSLSVRQTDLFLRPGNWALSEFETQFMKLTPLPMLLSRFRQISVGESQRLKTRFVLSGLGNMVERPGPHFVYAHIVCPHSPYVFNADGSDADPETSNADIEFLKKTNPERFRLAYLNQVQFISREIIKVITSIIKESPDSYIILQGDHGPQMNVSLFGMKNGPAALKERMGILNAYYFPHGHEKLYPKISPVNTFRVLLNELFQDDLPLLADRSFFSPMDDLALLQEITDQVNSP